MHKKHWLYVVCIAALLRSVTFTTYVVVVVVVVDFIQHLGQQLN